MADSVDRLKELLFQQESATLAELEQRIARVAAAEAQARTQLAEGLHQLEQIRQLAENGRANQSRLEQRLTSLDARTGTPEALQASVAEVIDGVIDQAREFRQDDLSRALAPMMVKTIKAELKNNQAEMVEALYPITGQLVKAYVASAMRDLTNRMNRGFQSNGFMLRLRSLFSGYSMAELKLAESQQLEVEELYLIRRGSGELLQRFPESLQRSNSDAHMSGVLAAINDFAANAFQGEGGHLRSFDLDDFTLFLRASPVYLLAAKCRGVAVPGVEGLIDNQFLDSVGRLHEAETSGADATMPTRLLADLKTRVEAGITEKHEELSSAGMPFSPLRAMVFVGALAVLAGGGWYAWTTWEVEQTRNAARQAIAATPSMSGYPVSLEVGSRGQSISISGLAPSESAKSELMTRLSTALQGVVIADRGLAALPGMGPDLSPSIAAVRRDLGGVETAVRRDLGGIETAVRREIGGLELNVRKELGSLETTLRRDLGTLEQQISRAAAARSLDRARRRLQEALPDLGALLALQDPARRGLVGAARGSVETAIATIGAQATALRDDKLDATRQAHVADALAATTAQLRKAALDLGGLIGQRPAAAGPQAAAPSAGGDISDVAESTAIGAERLATVSAAVLQAASIRIPEPPKIVPPSARDQLAAFASRSAVFFAANDDFRDTAKATAIIGEIARLAKEAGVLVRVIGYTDERGGQSRNSQIAQMRADKVAQALVSRGLPRSQIVAVGRATGPDLSPNAGADSPNRRVEFEIGFDSEPVAGP